MLIRMNTAAIAGVEGYPVTVETDISRGMPEFAIVGLGDATIRESVKRIRPAIYNSGYSFPVEKLTVNLMPAARPKEGSHFDLPIAVSIILLMEQREGPGQTAALGELSLDGRINPVRGVLPMVIGLRRAGTEEIILPRENAEEAAFVKDVRIRGAATLREVIDHMTGERSLPIYKGNKPVGLSASDLDYAQVIGQEAVKRAMIIGAAGRHGMILMGSPGCGKTMMARRLPTILPAMTDEEQMEVTAIYSVAGLLSREHPIVDQRPFRSPHHSITQVGMIGGGVKPRPGEISLAHRGVLFLDELGEFEMRVVDSLRQPVEEGCVRINRNLTELIFPSRVMVVVASNPCKCGNLWDPRRVCTCTPRQLESHRRRLAGPFSDRIDMHIRMMPVDRKLLTLCAEERRSMSSAQMRRQVEKAREMQKERYAGREYTFNAGLDEQGLERFCALDGQCLAMMTVAYEKMNLSMRGYHRIIRLARTIADLEGKEKIGTAHIAEALSYRMVDAEEQE